MKPIVAFIAFWVGALIVPAEFQANGAPVHTEDISLAGSWRFAIDPADAGIRESWYLDRLPHKIRLPGSMPEQGLGEPISTETHWTGQIVDRSWFTAPEYAAYRQPQNVKIPFWLQPDTYYAGPAWYQREVEVPNHWVGKRIELLLERPHWETHVWIDNRSVSTNVSLSTPHVHDLGVLSPGPHTVTVRVDNRMVVDIGNNSHSISDHTQGNWNGIVGKIALRSTPLVWIDDLQAYPRAESKSVLVKSRIRNATSQSGNGTARLHLRSETHNVTRSIAVAWDRGGGSFETEIALGNDAPLWSEFEPALHHLTLELESGDPGMIQRDTRSIQFGLREIGTAGTQFLINGNKTFFRGTLECAIFPKTGHPPTDIASWKRIIQIAKAHGLNLIRFHSWCPPEAAFSAADELGFYFHVEAASWANGSTTLGDGKPVDQWVYDETTQILRAYGNHPSFLLMAYGNEPGGRRHKSYLAEWTTRFKETDPRRLYTSGAGWPQIEENEFHVAPEPRIQAWGAGLKSRINAHPPETITDYRDYIRAQAVPVISHEIGQWCVYPNFDEIGKYSGYLKPKNFEIFRDRLREHHMEDLARRFLNASGKLQTLCYKEDIESALRTPGMGGFELLDLHDFPGQGTALVGVLDPFWESKGYVTAEEFSRFCHSTVPLARLGKRVFRNDEILKADLEAAHFGPEPLTNAGITWNLVNDSESVVASGRFPSINLPIDNGIAIGTLQLPLANLPSPARYRLVVRISKSTGASARFENDWHIWVYPSRVETSVPETIAVANALDDAALAVLRGGGKLLLLIPPDQVAPDRKLGKIALGFSSIFWNTAWTHRQAPHTLGILCDPQHPLFASFPTDPHSNWQWWYLLNHASPMILDDMPDSFRPTIQVIDDWVTARRLGLVFEAKIAGGSLLACSIDIERDLEGNIVARQFRRSLLDYMRSDRFLPTMEITTDQAGRLVR